MDLFRSSYVFDYKLEFLSNIAIDWEYVWLTGDGTKMMFIPPWNLKSSFYVFNNWHFTFPVYYL